MKEKTLDEIWQTEHKPLMVRRLAFLQSTAEHYYATNRSAASAGYYYSPAHDETEGCAIGRFLTPELAKELDKKKFLNKKGDFSNAVDNDDVFNLLPDIMKSLGQKFLISMQRLHDIDGYWDSEGLSEGGKKRYQTIDEGVRNGKYD